MADEIAPKPRVGVEPTPPCERDRQQQRVLAIPKVLWSRLLDVFTQLSDLHSPEGAQVEGGREEKEKREVEPTNESEKIAIESVGRWDT